VTKHNSENAEKKQQPPKHTHTMSSPSQTNPATTSDKANGPSSQDSSGSKGAKRGRKKGTKNKKKAGVWEDYKVYNHRVLKRINKRAGISKRSAVIMNCFVNDMLSRLILKSHELCELKGSMTVTEKEIQTAAALILSGNLSKKAQAYSTKAIAQFEQANYTSRAAKASPSPTVVEPVA